jgi:hypothetical protein
MRMMVGKRLDGLKLPLLSRPVPIGLELHAAQPCPFGYKASRMARQRAGDHVAIEVDRGSLACIAGVEMRLRVVSFVPVHVDRDPVEEADPRHCLTVRSRPALDATL